MIILFNDSPQYPNRSVGIYRIATVLRRYGLEVEVIDYISRWEKLDHVLFDYLDKIENVEWWGFSTKFKLPLQKLNKNQAPGVGAQDIYEGTFIQSSMSFENKIINYIRTRGGPVVVGGPNTDAVKITCDFGKIDILCNGYADTGVLAIHEHIVNNKDLIYTRFNGMKIVDCDDNYKDIDLSQIDTEYHYTDFITQNEVFPIEISRGCIFQCAFCSFGHLGKKPGTYIRTKESITKDLVDRYTKYGSTKFLFVDDTFNDSLEKMQLIKDIRNETGIPFEFWSYARLDLLRAQPKMVDLIEDIGWTSFTFGIETMNKASGKSVGKGADPDKLKEFLIKLRERYPKHKFQINLIVGLPHDTEETVKDTVQWFIDNPSIATNIRIRELNIQRPEVIKNSSKIAKDPKSYGYEVDPPKHSFAIMVNWKTENLTRTKAAELSVEMQNLLNYHLHTNNPITAATAMDDNLLTVVEGGNTFNKKSAVQIKNYIRSKRKFRGV